MTNERWRMAGDDRDKRFNPPIGDDDFPDYDDFPDFGEDDFGDADFSELETRRKKMSIAKAWTIVAGSIGVVVIVASVIALCLMFGLKPLGITLAYREALVVAVSFVVLRFVDLSFSASLQRRNK